MFLSPLELPCDSLREERCVKQILPLKKKKKREKGKEKKNRAGPESKAAEDLTSRWNAIGVIQVIEVIHPAARPVVPVPHRRGRKKSLVAMTRAFNPVSRDPLRMASVTRTSQLKRTVNASVYRIHQTEDGKRVKKRPNPP